MESCANLGLHGGLGGTNLSLRESKDLSVVALKMHSHRKHGVGTEVFSNEKKNKIQGNIFQENVM